MKLKNFVEDYDGAPYELQEFAELAAQVTNHSELQAAALAYLKAKETFEATLSEVGVQLG